MSSAAPLRRCWVTRTRRPNESAWRLDVASVAQIHGSLWLLAGLEYD